jgi:integrase
MLTKSEIDRAPARARPFVLWEAETPGFGCRVFPSGKRSFIVQYRLKGSRKSVMQTLGPYGQLTLDQARKLAKDQLATVRVGADPKAEQKARTLQERGAALTVDKLIADYVAGLRNGSAATKRTRGRLPTPAYIKDTELQLSRFAAAYGSRPAAEINRGELRALLDPCKTQHCLHRRLWGAINRMYVWANETERLAGMPTSGIATTPSHERVKDLSLEQLRSIWRAADHLNERYRDVVHLMILLGQRRNEIAGMKWGEIDLDKAVWTMPPARVKNRRQHVLPLGPLALSILQARREQFQHAPHKNDLVIPTLSRNGRGETTISGWSWIKRKLDQLSGVKDWQQHDYRGSIVTICGDAGIENVDTLDTLLSHASSQTRAGIKGRYNKAKLLGQQRRAIEAWEALLREAIGLPPPAATELREVHAA